VAVLSQNLQELNLPHLDFIKMDIEGAEIEALIGAAKTLETLSPKLAIASYHRRDKSQTFGAVE
jgi:FkbM family methyltransferase